MAGSVRRLTDQIGLPLREALRMATSNPARLMGLSGEIGCLQPGAHADIVLL